MTTTAERKHYTVSYELMGKPYTLKVYADASAEESEIICMAKKQLQRFGADNLPAGCTNFQLLKQ